MLLSYSSIQKCCRGKEKPVGQSWVFCHGMLSHRETVLLEISSCLSSPRWVLLDNVSTKLMISSLSVFFYSETSYEGIFFSVQDSIENSRLKGTSLYFQQIRICLSFDNIAFYVICSFTWKPHLRGISFVQDSLFGTPTDYIKGASSFNLYWIVWVPKFMKFYYLSNIYFYYF